ncbi:NAD(P)H-binding protein [Nonomuraea sp. NPDC046570]|uniref:NAD(P)H-binding protein n=1 Tax=Nonomuraea sp. NPDC046570 TaxID=3155255 RepID=UPI0033D6D0AE
MILVIGATGNVGRPTVSYLREAGAKVRALVRNPSTAGLPADVETVQGDLTRPETVEAALGGVDTVFLIWPGFGVENAAAVVDAIARHARRVVYLSADMPDLAEGEESSLFHQDIERLIRASGLEWTFLKPGGFATNTLGWAEQIRRDGVVRWPYGQGGRSLIHEADIAAVAALTLTQEGHTGAGYVLTGPEVLTQADQVRVIGEVIGRPARWEEIAPEEARERLLASWGDATFVDGVLKAWGRLVDEPEGVTDTVERLTGRPARTFRSWVADHADAFTGED